MRYNHQRAEEVFNKVIPESELTTLENRLVFLDVLLNEYESEDEVQKLYNRLGIEDFLHLILFSQLWFEEKPKKGSTTEIESRTVQDPASKKHYIYYALKMGNGSEARVGLLSTNLKYQAYYAEVTAEKEEISLALRWRLEQLYSHNHPQEAQRKKKITDIKTVSIALASILAYLVVVGYVCLQAYWNFEQLQKPFFDSKILFSSPNAALAFGLGLFFGIMLLLLFVSPVIAGLYNSARSYLLKLSGKQTNFSPAQGVTLHMLKAVWPAPTTVVVIFLLLCYFSLNANTRFLEDRIVSRQMFTFSESSLIYTEIDSVHFNINRYLPQGKESTSILIEYFVQQDNQRIFLIKGGPVEVPANDIVKASFDEFEKQGTRVQFSEIRPEYYDDMKGYSSDLEAQMIELFRYIESRQD